MNKTSKFDKIMATGFLVNLLVLLSKGYLDERLECFLMGAGFSLILVGILRSRFYLQKLKPWKK
ncbi:MAG: hypothetical protein RR690_06265 [Longicatena sp.]